MPGVAVNMDIRIDTWKKKLLDLSRRNRLLNYRESKRSDLLILKPSMNELWDAFVVKEKPISFPYVEEDGDGVDRRPVDRRSEIETSKSLREQQKTLRNLRNKARSYIMEQGVNALYLAFGFVKWRESSHSDQWMSAPLILVPATLKWDSIVSPFVLTPHDDEIVLNPTLAHKFESDFGIVLPSFDAEVSLGRYLDEVREMVSPQGWTVADDVSLSLLSFLKSESIEACG